MEDGKTERDLSGLPQKNTTQRYRNNKPINDNDT